MGVGKEHTHVGTPIPPDTPGTSWSVVVPVKALARAKSRLAGVAGHYRQALALAVATDTVEATLGCPRVGRLIVVTDDATVAEAMASLGAGVVDDEPDAGLNPALRHGAARAAEAAPGEGVAALSADLPALRGHELARALDAARLWGTGFVPDAAGLGTTLYTATPGAAFQPRFGPDSRQRHIFAGAAELRPPGIDTVRRDVDTLDDVDAALRLGVGPRSTRVIPMLPRRADMRGV